MNTFTCSACGGRFHIDDRGFDGMCVDCTADRNNAFDYLEDDRDEDRGRYVSGYRVYRDGSYREDFGADR